MKNNDLKIFEENEKLKRYIEEPEWFKKSLLSACTREEKRINHLLYSRFSLKGEENEKLPVVTTLRNIRAVLPDVLSPVEEPIEVNSSNINLDTCVILFSRDEDSEEFIEPLSGLKVSAEFLYGQSECDDIFEKTIYNDTFLVLEEPNDCDIKPFGYVDSEILKMWKEKTLPYKDELVEHLNKIKKRSLNNFGKSFITEEEVSKCLNLKK